MFVPDPVISLSLKPKGLETPNFSRALNRFQKEDPTFKVHIDHESKEVSTHFKLCALFTYAAFRRPLSLEWGNSIWKSMSNV